MSARIADHATEVGSVARWMEVMSGATAREPSPHGISEIYDEALPEVFGYLRARCPSVELAEELTSATFVQAAITVADGGPPNGLSIGWLITVARNKLVDHWRRHAVVERSLVALEGGQTDDEPWDAVIDQARAAEVLAALSPSHRLALTLRYLDDLTVPECADALGKSVHATESLLVRARAAFRTTYELTGGRDDD